MLVYRSFVVGMLGAIALLIASLPGELAERQAERELPRSVITISRSALAQSPDPASTVADLIAHTRGERVLVVITR